MSFFPLPQSDSFSKDSTFQQERDNPYEISISCGSVYTFILIYALPKYAIGGYPNAEQK